MCVFYLVLRALDTVEDDMTISVEKKIPMLRNFHTFLYEPEWRFMESKEKHRQVLEDFPTVVDSLLGTYVANWQCCCQSAPGLKAAGDVMAENSGS